MRKGLFVSKEAKSHVLPNSAPDDAAGSMIHKWERPVAVLIVVAFVALALGFSFGPIFEGPDEIEHYRYARILARTGALPDPFSQPEGELHQAPLYYMLAAPLVALADDGDFDQIDGRRNPYHGYEIGIPGNDNKNVYLHTRSEAFPYRDSDVARTVHELRLLSIALGVGTLLASYAAFHILWPDRPDRRLLALGFVAFLPQFAYMSSVVSNDVLLYFLTTLSLWLLLRQDRDGPTWRNSAWLGVVLGAALLSEVSAAFLVFPVGVATLLDRRRWRYAPLTLGLTLAVCGWWYARNAILYGDPTGVQAVFAMWPTDPLSSTGGPALAEGIPRAAYAYRGFWARFGYGAVAVGKPLHVIFDALTLLTLAGLAVKAVRWRQSRGDDRLNAARPALITGTLALVWLAALVYWSSTVSTGNQGRLLLPAITAWGALFSLGLDSWTPVRQRMGAALGSIGLLATLATLSLFVYFLPAYRVSGMAEPVEQPLALRFGDVAELTGMTPAMPHARPGETLRVTLYWRAIDAAHEQMQAYLHTADSSLVRRDSLPGTGNLLASDWQPGDTWSETYVVVIPDDAEEQRTYPLLAGLYDPLTGETLAAFNADGEAVTPFVGWLAVNGPSQPTEPDFRFGDALGMANLVTSVEGEALSVCVSWVSLAPVATNYQVFVHVLDDEGVVAQADVQPRGGTYPTSAWVPGERIDDCMALRLPEDAGTDWRVGVGLYDLSNGQRLPALDSEGRALDDDVVLLSG